VRVRVSILLRRVRRGSGLSQRALARRAGVPQSTVARIELGALSPRTDTLERLLLAAGQELSVEPKLGIGVDRSQIRDLLRLAPRQRLELAARDAAGLRRLDLRT
jgi:transcriptional regulator with XRE-family HTH domain